MTRRAAAAWRCARRRHGGLDHLARAVVRYDEADGGRLAAAITYYAFFATFAFALLGFAAFGFILDNPAVQHPLQSYLADNLPGLDVQRLRVARGTVGIVAFLGLPVTGWFWTDAMRSSIRKVWRLPEYPGALLARLLIDLLALIGLGLLVGRLPRHGVRDRCRRQPSDRHDRRRRRPDCHQGSALPGRIVSRQQVMINDGLFEIKEIRGQRGPSGRDDSPAMSP